MTTYCSLCETDGGAVLWQGDRLRIVAVDDTHYPGFVRVIWNDHVAEMSDLSTPDRSLLFGTVLLVEQAVRRYMQPDKINLASLGNQVPHLHWHIIPRYRDDPHFPAPVWASLRPERMQDEGWQIRHAERQARALALNDALRAQSLSD
ncbi:MAG: HIT family protein [Burkholderiaceae bacterium]|nr:MAG: HIT family protein [Burkholderiaceae bacterium]